MLEGLWCFVAVGASRDGILVVPRVVFCKVALSRAHLVDSSCDKLHKPHEGVRVDRGGIGVVWGG